MVEDDSENDKPGLLNEGIPCVSYLTDHEKTLWA